MNRHELERLWRVGIAAVEGRQAVSSALTIDDVARPDHMFAVGKAAGAMAFGAFDVFGPDLSGLVVTKYDHTPDGLPRRCKVIEAAHPIPDAASLHAGAVLKQAMGQVAEGAHLLCLISGGASALAELPKAGLLLDDLQALNSDAISKGLAIGQINKLRNDVSQIKGGKLFAGLPDCKLTVLALSDVEGDSLGTIGSGLFDCHATAVPSSVAVKSIMAGSNKTMRDRIAAKATVPVVANDEALYGDVLDVADRIAARVQDGPSGLYIFGGEPTVILPDQPGKGGRNQSLAVALSQRLPGLAGLVTGTDGTDGPTDAAGGFLGDISDPKAADKALISADAYRYLAQRGDLFRPGPTGTNVMDVVLIAKP